MYDTKQVIWFGIEMYDENDLCSILAKGAVLFNMS